MESTQKKLTTEYEIKIDDTAKKVSQKLESGKIYKLQIQFTDGKYDTLPANLVLKTRTEHELDGLNVEKMLENDQFLLKELNARIQKEIDWVEKGEDYRTICKLMLDASAWIIHARRPMFILQKSIEGLMEVRESITELKEQIVSDQPVPSGTLTKILKDLLGTTPEKVSIVVKEVLDGY